MMTRWIAAAALLLVPGVAQAQEQWYLTGAGTENHSLVFTERTSVRANGSQARATVLILKREDADGMTVVQGTMVFDCPGGKFRMAVVQRLDEDGNPQGAPLDMGSMDWIDIKPGSLFDETRRFACGGSARPDPELLIGDTAPVQKGLAVLRGN